MWLLATGAAGLVVRHELDEAFDSALQETAQRLLPLAVTDLFERANGNAPRRVAPLAEHEEYLTYILRDRVGDVLLHSHDADTTIFPASPAVGFRETATHRIYGESAVSGTYFIEVAEPLDHRQEAAAEALLALAGPVVVLLPASILWVWWFVRRSMRPVLTLGSQIEMRGGGDLSPLTARGLPGEIEPIAHSVNRLMERLKRTLDAERSFTANAAHELRTPIAGALAGTQRLIADAPAGPTRERARAVEESLRRLARLSEKLLQLAKAEGGGLLSESANDLGPILLHLVEEFRRSDAMRPRLHLSVSEQAALQSRLDGDAFAILMRNLIENAVGHSPPGTPVEIVAGDGHVRVANEGPVLPPAALARLKGRFARGETEANGSGLGLAIAEAIASGAGGRLTLRSPATGRVDGFEARLDLPA